MKLTENIRKLFQRKNTTSPTGGGQEGAVPLRIEGIADAPLTPEPDEAELAAQAVLEIMVDQQTHQTHQTQQSHESHKPHESNDSPPPHYAKYYEQLATEMRKAREASRLRVTRFLAFVEQELRKPHLPAYGPGSLELLKAELYKRMDVIDREQGELKRRWQNCLAEVTFRLMKAGGGLEGNHDNKK